MKTLIVGNGEVGSSLKKIIEQYHDTLIRDIGDLEVKDVEILQICFPECVNFSDQVNKYKEQYKPKLTIINSSVSIGTTDKCGENVVYSPVRGRHRPDLSLELRYFHKFIAGKSYADLSLAKKYFEACEWRTVTTRDIRGLELSKLVSNIHMGLEVAWAQEMRRVYKKLDGDIQTYLDWENSYNEGYKSLDQTHLMRPIMKPDPIGGHCILECTEILQKQFWSPAFDFIFVSNALEKIKEEENGKTEGK